jgi:hypothetical protein
MVSHVKPASDFDRIAFNVAIWHGYDPGVKADLYSTCLLASGAAYLVDPIPLPSDAFDELIGSAHLAGIVVTNSNHHRASAHFAEQFSSPIFARSETFQAAAGEIVLYCAPRGGTLIVGDALINREPYGFAFLPRKYCSNEKQMRRSLRKLLDYKAERMLFVHGTPILSGASDRLQRLLDSDL